MKIRTDEITTIAGMRGEGKTTLAKNILTKVKKKKLVYDPVAEYPKHISYVPKRDTPGEFEAICKRVWEKGNIYFCVDEAERYFPNNKPLGYYATRIVNTGRHRGIGVLAITRRIANLSKTVFGLSSTVICFRLFAPTDLRYISEFLNPEEIAGLKKYKYVVYTV